MRAIWRCGNPASSARLIASERCALARASSATAEAKPASGDLPGDEQANETQAEAETPDGHPEPAARVLGQITPCARRTGALDHPVQHLWRAAHGPRPGTAARGTAWVSRRGRARLGEAAHGNAWTGSVWLRWAWRGTARRGSVWHGNSFDKVSGSCLPVPAGNSQHSPARRCEVTLRGDWSHLSKGGASCAGNVKFGA